MTSLSKLTVAAAVTLSAGAASAQEHTFTLHHFLSAESPSHTEMLVPWARQVEENANGAVAIEIFPSMTRGGRPTELVSQARDGIVDLIWTLNGYTPGLFPRTEVFELPNIFNGDIPATNLAMNDLFADQLAPDYRGLEVMFLHAHAGQGIQTADTEVRTPEDFAGLSMRIPTRTGAWVIEELGGNPVSMPIPDLPQALSTGVVDGALIPWEVIPALQLQEQSEYQIEGQDNYRLGTSIFQVSMNQARWDGLPDDIKQAFRDASNREWLVELGNIWREVEQAGLQIAVEAGNEHIVLTADETQAFRDGVQPVIQRWIDDVSGEGVDGEALVQAARDAISANEGAGGQ